MKPKTFYILMIVCSMSLFSSAKQTGKYCDKKTCCEYNKQQSMKQGKVAQQTDLDMPPLRLMFGI